MSETNPFEMVSGDDSTFTDMAASTRLSEETDYDGISQKESYESEDGGRQTDAVDPQKLWGEHTVDELRYYAREGEFGGTIINKPVEDAFKHGFRIENDYSDSVKSFLDEYIPKYKLGEKKARRDGLSILFFQLRDSGDITDEPRNVLEYTDIRVLTLDRLTDTISKTEAAESYDLEYEQITITDEGVVICDDLTHPKHGEVLGYGVEVRKQPNKVQFVHAERCQHLVWNEEVDGDVDDDVFGHIVGDSILSAPLAAMKAIKKGNYAMGEALYRYSAPLHAAETPADYGEENFEQVQDKMHDLSMMSSAVLPPGVELKTHEGATDFDPAPFYDVLIQNICASTEFTKPVLMGTQTGTVSGSETDIKNYFNAVEKFRQNRAEAKMNEAVSKVHSWLPSEIPTFSLAYNVQWKPLFKLDRLEQAEAKRVAMNTASQAVNTYVMSPSEARSFIEEQFVRVGEDIDLGDLSEDEWEELDRLNLAQNGVSESDVENQENPRLGNTNSEGEGGNEGSSEQSDPTT